LIHHPSVGLAEALAEALDACDRYTAGHSLRVADYAQAIAREIDLLPAEVETIRLAAWLHDVGKIGIPDAVLLKPGPLSAEEFGLIKLHPQIGRRILERAHGFELLLDAVGLHHENYDGTGYPYGLEGEADSSRRARDQSGGCLRRHAHAPFLPASPNA
jgi:putative nucleotidyltransferase with HDIG domain